MHYIFQLIFSFLFTISCFGQIKTLQDKKTLPTVVRVIDGDTVDMLDKDSIVRIRLYGIDAPERGQDFYAESKAVMEELVLNKAIYLDIKEKDRYGRLVAVIYRNADKMNVNYELVKKGMAWHFTRYSSDVQLAKLQADAREKELGLWSKYYYLEPWEFRKSHNKKQQAN